MVVPTPWPPLLTTIKPPLETTVPDAMAPFDTKKPPPEFARTTVWLVVPPLRLIAPPEETTASIAVPAERVNWPPLKTVVLDAVPPSISIWVPPAEIFVLMVVPPEDTINPALVLLNTMVLEAT